MQIVESSVLGVRSARIELKSNGNPVEITLFPMIHIGEPQFYEAVLRDAWSFDYVLVEGVKSPIVNALTRSYRWAERSNRLNLVLQSRFLGRDALNNFEGVRAHVVHADLEQKEFEQLWQKVPLWLRALAYVVPPGIGLHRRFFATRETIASRLEFSYLTSRDEWLNYDENFGLFHHAIRDARDERLIARLLETMDSCGSEPSRIAVVYGARHMRAVLKALTGEHRYSVTGTSWMTVFKL